MSTIPAVAEDDIGEPYTSRLSEGSFQIMDGRSRTPRSSRASSQRRHNRYEGSPLPSSEAAEKLGQRRTHSYSPRGGKPQSATEESTAGKTEYKVLLLQ